MTSQATSPLGHFSSGPSLGQGRPAKFQYHVTNTWAATVPQVTSHRAEWRSQPGNTIEHYTEAPEHIDWPVPFIPVLPEKDAYGKIVRTRPYFVADRSGWKSLGIDIVEWKRPAHNKIPEGFYVLGNSEHVPRSEIH